MFRTWRTIEVFYGRIYMERVRRRFLLTLAVVFIIGIALGWLAHG